MDPLGISPAKAVLLAVQIVTQVDLSTLRTLIAQHRRTFRLDLVLRILLSHLPESTDSSDYVPFLKDLVSASIVEDLEHVPDSSYLDDLEDGEAKKRVRRLNLLPLKWMNAPADVPDDPLVLFLMHRSLLIDANTGLIDQIPHLLTPFLHHSTYLRTWMISTVLPLLRLCYEYYPGEIPSLTIPKFEALNERAGVRLLLSKTGKNIGAKTVGRDLRGLVGPWMYGDTLTKRRKVLRSSSYDAATLSIDPSADAHKYAGWEEVFKWMHNQAATSWKTVVETIEQWDGPGDVDLGSYADGAEWLNEDDQLYLERRYARSILAAAYVIPVASEESLDGIQRMLTRIITLLDKDRIPTLQAAAALLIPVPTFSKIALTKSAAKYLGSELQDEDSIFTSPSEDSIRLLHALLISVYLCTRLGCAINIKTAGLLACLQDGEDQMNYFTLFMKQVTNGPKQDDEYWIRLRNEILWLRTWGGEELVNASGTGKGRGILGQLPKELVEAELLKTLLGNTRYDLARSIYETSADKPLSNKAVADAVIAAAMDAFDQATNPSRSRGGLKKADDILKSFPITLEVHVEAERLEHLIAVTDKIGYFRLVFKEGEPFKPVALRKQVDAIGIIAKLLDQNPGSFTNVDTFIDIAKAMIDAGLTKSGMPSYLQYSLASKRIVAMCIDAALTEDDFETAYSYVVTRLETNMIAATPEDLKIEESGFVSGKNTDDYSWRAALQAGRYKRNNRTVKPTHLGNASGNPEIRHLEQRMDCLSQALKLAPKDTLQEILNVFRRCEEELESHVEQEQEQSDAWDAQVDENAFMPGGFRPAPRPQMSSRVAEEAPMSLFELSRSTFGSALSTIKKTAPPLSVPSPMVKPGTPVNGANEALSTVPAARKRDQLRNAAVGGLASGVGWLIGAPSNASSIRDGDH